MHCVIDPTDLTGATGSEGGTVPLLNGQILTSTNKRENESKKEAVLWWGLILKKQKNKKNAHHPFRKGEGDSKQK